MAYKYAGIEIVEGMAEEIPLDPKWIPAIAKFVQLRPGFTHDGTRRLLELLFPGDALDLPPDYGDGAAVDPKVDVKYDVVAAALEVLDALERV